jgi:hypothetical protein
MAHRARSVTAEHTWVAGRRAGLDVSGGGWGGLLGGHAGELDAGGDAELPEDMPQVEGDGMGAQEDPAGHLAVAQALGHQVGDGAFGV